MKRNEWKFQQRAEELMRACEAKVRRHNKRIAFWEGEKTTAEIAVRAATVSFKEYDVTGGKRLEAQIDPALGVRLNECASRLMYHQKQRDEYELWKRTFDAARDAVLELQHDDVMYFGLGETDDDVAA